MKKTFNFNLTVFSLLLILAITVSFAQTTSSDFDSILKKNRFIPQEQFEVEPHGLDSLPQFVAPIYNAALESYSIEDVPSPRGKGIMGYVVDPKDIIGANQEDRINRRLYELEQISTVEVAVVILPGIGDKVPKKFAVDLFSKWGIGKSDTDNGLLVLVVMDQRRAEFEVGFGLEPILTDVVCYRIGVNEIVPNFKLGKYGLGIERSIVRIKQFIENPTVVNEVYGYGVDYEKEPFKWKWYHILLVLYFLLCLIMGFWYFGQAFDIERSKDDFYDKYQRLNKLKFGCTSLLFPFPMLFFSKMRKNRLHRYRTGPRFSKKNGMAMHLLSNYDEIDFLEEIQLLEEELQSVLYDVWITEDKSDIMILQYQGPNGRKYNNCEKCTYKTFGRVSSKIIISATYDRTGTRLEKYECRNCNYKEEKEVIIPKKVRASESSSSSSFSSSSSSSSSSFGGGSSGGGGAGVSW